MLYDAIVLGARIGITAFVAALVLLCCVGVAAGVLALAGRIFGGRKDNS